MGNDHHIINDVIHLLDAEMLEEKYIVGLCGIYRPRRTVFISSKLPAE